MAGLRWVSELVGENFLALYDVVADIHKERQLVGDGVDIPLYQQVVKFPQLLPADTSGLRDRYCELRWKAVKLLETRGAVTAVTLQPGEHRWDGVIRLKVLDQPFSKVVATVEKEMARLAEQPASPNDAKDAVRSDDTDEHVRGTASTAIQPLLLPERVSLRWLATHVPVSLWLSLLGTYVAVFAIGVKLGDVPALRRVVGEAPLSGSTTSPAEASFLPGDLEIAGLSSAGAAPPVTVQVMATAENGSVRLSRRAEILGQSYDRQYIMFGELEPEAELLSIAPDRAVIRPGEQETAKIAIQFDCSSIIPQGHVVGDLRAGEKIRVGGINVRLYFSIGKDTRSADFEIPVYLTK